MRRLFLVSICLLILIGVGFGISGYYNKETITTKITDKEKVLKIIDGNSETYYLIYTEKGTYKLNDDLFYGNFRSSDWYGKIRRDSTYTFDVIGYRIGFVSSYQRIVKIRGIK